MDYGVICKIKKNIKAFALCQQNKTAVDNPERPLSKGPPLESQWSLDF